MRSGPCGHHHNLQIHVDYFFQSLIDNDLVLVADIRMTFYCVKKNKIKNYWFSFDFITSLTLSVCIYLHIYIYMCVHPCSHTYVHIHKHIYSVLFSRGDACVGAVAASGICA